MKACLQSRCSPELSYTPTVGPFIRKHLRPFQNPFPRIFMTNGVNPCLGIPLLHGRELAASDTATSNPVVVINQKLAEVIWPGQDPLGKHLNILSEKQFEVVRHRRQRSAQWPLRTCPGRKLSGLLAESLGLCGTRDSPPRRPRRALLRCARNCCRAGHRASRARHASHGTSRRRNSCHTTPYTLARRRLWGARPQPSPELSFNGTLQSLPSLGVRSAPHRIPVVGSCSIVAIQSIVGASYLIALRQRLARHPELFTSSMTGHPLIDTRLAF
jgi:hypothetical protein